MYGLDDFDTGSFASHSVWREAYLFKVPNSIPNEYAAPLMCGGATVFNALEMYVVRPTDRVGIIKLLLQDQGKYKAAKEINQ